MRILPALMMAALTTACDPDSSGVNGDAEAWFSVVDTHQHDCYAVDGTEYDCSTDAGPAGQDGHYAWDDPLYTDNGDETVSDEVTGLMWQRVPQTGAYADAASLCAEADTGGHADWRVPNIKELYALMRYDGRTGTAAPDSLEAPSDAVPYLDDAVFEFSYGSTRYIDVQYVTTTEYVDLTMGRDESFFGVNFADGRIKGYPTDRNSYFVQCVRGDEIGANAFVDQGDGTILDEATGLTWTQQDSGSLSDTGELDWEGALAFCEGLELAGQDDWRLPDVKELQTIVDYTRSPATTDSAAIDPVFESTPIVNEAGEDDFGFYWSSTTHLDGQTPGSWASYVVFGRGLGFFNDEYLDVHGAGSQRSDPKSASGADIGCGGNSPQGDCIRVYNFARCVR